jgi:hypothetical protein
VSSFHEKYGTFSEEKIFFYLNFFSGLEYVGHSFAYVAQFAFLRDVWIQTQRAAVASKARYQLSHPFP